MLPLTLFYAEHCQWPENEEELKKFTTMYDLGEKLNIPLNYSTFSDLVFIPRPDGGG